MSLKAAMSMPYYKMEHRRKPVNVYPGLVSGSVRDSDETDDTWHTGRLMIFLIQLGLDFQTCQDVYTDIFHRPTQEVRRHSPSPVKGPA